MVGGRGHDPLGQILRFVRRQVRQALSPDRRNDVARHVDRLDGNLVLPCVGEDVLVVVPVITPGVVPARPGEELGVAHSAAVPLVQCGLGRHGKHLEADDHGPSRLVQGANGAKLDPVELGAGVGLADEQHLDVSQPPRQVVGNDHLTGMGVGHRVDADRYFFLAPVEIAEGKRIRTGLRLEWPRRSDGQERGHGHACEHGGIVSSARRIPGNLPECLAQPDDRRRRGTMSAHGLCRPGPDRPQGLASVPGHDDLRRSGVAGLGTSRGASQGLRRTGARTRHQLLRYRRHVLVRRQRGNPRSRPAGLSRRRDRSSSPPRSTTRWATAPTTAACRASTSSTPSTTRLRRLGTDYIDLYQIHRFDPATPIEETLERARRPRARRQGAVHRSVEHVRVAVRQDAHTLADRHGWPRFVSMQNHYNLVYREEEREMMPLCREEGIGVIPWSPLGAWFSRRQPPRHGPRRHDAGQERRLRARAVLQTPRTSPWSSGWWTSPAGGASSRPRWRWPGCCRQPGVTAPIIGASKPGHLKDAVDALALELTTDECAELETPYVPHRVLGHG